MRRRPCKKSPSQPEVRVVAGPAQYSNVSSNFMADAAAIRHIFYAPEPLGRSAVSGDRSTS
jgi:hypothetical protein